jgi:hypothetical protein
MIARIAFAASIAAFTSLAFGAPEIEFTPGAASKSYRKIHVSPPSVDFQRRFLKDSATLRGARHGRVEPEEVRRLEQELGQGFRDALAEAFRNQGFEVVPTPGQEVLTISPSLKDLYVNRPNDPKVMRHYYVREAGEARMIVEASDFSGSRVLRASRQASAGETAAHHAGSDVGRRADFKGMFQAWAQDVASALAAGK